MPPLNAQVLTAKAAKGIKDALQILKEWGCPGTDELVDSPMLEGHKVPVIYLEEDGQGSAHLTGETYLLQDSLIKIGFVKSEGGGMVVCYDGDVTHDTVMHHLAKLCSLRGWELYSDAD